jgi:hypothetical protein
MQRVIIFTFTLLLAVAAWAAPAAILTNGDFETDANGDKWPDDWAHPAGATWELDMPTAAAPADPEADKPAPEKPDPAKLGHFLRLTAAPGKLVMLYRAVPLPADVKALAFTWRQRVSRLKPGAQPWYDARILFEFKDAAGTKLKHGVGAPYARRSTDGWVTREMKLLLPDGAATMEFMPCLFQVEAGEFDFDDLVMTPTDPAPLVEAAQARAAADKVKAEKELAARQAKAAAAVQPDGNIYGNGGFETDKNADGWPDGWARLKEGGSWEADGDNHFLRLTVTEAGKTVLLYHKVDLPKDTKALELAWRQRITGLKPGKEAWFDARIMLEFQDLKGNKLPGSPGAPYARKDTAGWVARSARFLVPDGAVSLVIMPCLFQVVAGTLDLDDLTLKAADPEALKAAATAAAEAERLANVPPEAPAPDKWPPELHVKGNQVLTKDNTPVVLQGVNVDSLEFLVKGDHVMKSTLVAVDEWKSKIIRLPVKDDYWYGRTTEQKDGGTAYRKLVDDVITLAANHGAYVLLDLHRFRAPKQGQLTFWKDAATHFKNHPAVLFDIFNEPHGMSWEIWRNGGFIPDKNAPADEDAFLTPEEKALNAKGFHSVGMQALVTAIRATGARNIIVAGGLDWAYDLSGVVKGFALDDTTGNGIVYATHIYPWKFKWQEHVLVAAEKYPVLVGEVGADIKKMDFIPESAQEDPYTWCPDVLGFMQQHKLHWTAWCFHPSSSPRMILDWTYTPTPFWGAFVKRALAGERFTMTRIR